MTDLIPDEEGFTELVDPNVPRVDLVGRPANGSPGFLLMKQDTQAGLMSPDAIRDLIGKSSPEPDPAPEETVTMTGSPGAIAKLMHEAALRARERNNLAKAKYDTADRKRMAGHEAMDDGSYPIADKEDLANAIHAVGRGNGDHDAIRRHVIARAKVLGASSEIPDNWAADGSLKEVSKMIGGDMDEGQDGLDPTVVLASPDDVTEAPGSPTEPGSPAWEAIDAATARKWTSILARARSALEVMSDREMLEAASVDPDDAQDACDLQDAACAIDYAISILAPFAVDEQAEADCGTDMQAVGKALAGFDAQSLDTIEAAAAVRKAGRVLSAANEQAIRTAAEHLQNVLASLPAAPVEKTANEEPNMPEPTVSEDVTDASGQEPAMGAAEPPAKAVEKTAEAEVRLAPSEHVLAGEAVRGVAKAGGEKTPMVVVYDQKGRLIGIVDPGDVTPVANAEAEPEDMDTADGADDGDDGSDDGNDDTQTPDLEPQPADQAGTSADATSDDDDQAVTKSTNDTDLSEMLKSSLLPALEEIVKTHSATQEKRVATTGAAVLELAEMVKTLEDEVKKLGAEPAEPKVFTQGAGPRPLAQHLRGHDQGATPVEVDLTKAAELKKQLYTGTDAGAQQQAFLGLQEMAIAQLAAMRAGQ